MDYYISVNPLFYLKMENWRCDMSNTDLLPLDRKVAKRNIRKKMKEKGLSQKTVYERMRMTQGDFSNCTNVNSEGKFFSLDRLWELSQIFDCSIDELLGKGDVPQAKQNSEEISLSDVCVALTYFNEIVRPEYSLDKNGKTMIIYSDIASINELIRKFAQIKDEPELLTYYTQGFIRDHKNIIRKYKFQTEYEYGKKLLDAILKSNTLQVLADDVLKNKEQYYKADNLKHELEKLYEVFPENQRICAYNAIPQYIKENEFIENSTKVLILTNFRIIYDEQHHKEE